MSQALYRKYRPQTFDEVYGQDNVVNILKNQIVNDKISHAYLFSGIRGTGKTTCARIFARAVNCLNPVNGNPCNECKNCKAILEESTMDVVEMDAASNRRIDDIRQLRDTVIYPPTDLKYKVYIIDEAHMITNEAFNALLKIMEEPPKHLIFIMATTEVEKIPDTILSRTQRYELKRIDNQYIYKLIDDILQKEDVKMDQEAIDAIAEIGKGSMRDALSTLDQVISIGEDHFDLDKINDILGIVGEKSNINFFTSVINKDMTSLVAMVDRELDKGKDSNKIIKELIAFVESLMDIKIAYVKKDFMPSKAAVDLASNLDLDFLVNSLDILIDYEGKIKKSDNRNLLLKMAAIRLVDNTPKDVMASRIKALESRISSLENGFVPQVPKEIPSTQPQKEPLSIANGNPFDDFKKEAKKEDEIKEDLEVKKSLEESKLYEEGDELMADPVEEAPAEEVSKENPKQEISSKEKPAQSPEILEKRQKAIEHAIRNFVLKKFSSSKQLYDQVQGYRFSNEQLIYQVNERGYAFSKVMSSLFRETEEAFYRQTKQKVVIKFELKPSVVEENSKDEDKESVERIKRYFGEDKVEIID